MTKIKKPKPFENIEEAREKYPTAKEFRDALVDDIHSGTERFSLLSNKDLFESCLGSADPENHRVSMRPSNRHLFLTSDTGWWFICTFSFPGRNRRRIRFKVWMGDGGVIDEYEDPYIFRRRKISKPE